MLFFNIKMGISLSLGINAEQLLPLEYPCRFGFVLCHFSWQVGSRIQFISACCLLLRVWVRIYSQITVFVLGKSGKVQGAGPKLWLAVVFVASIIFELAAEMKEVYLLMPLLVSPNSHLLDIQKTLAITSQQYELYQFDDNKFAVELKQLKLGYQELIDTLAEHTHIKNKLKLLESNLKQHELGARENSVQGVSMDSLMRKAIKYKEVKEENRKLKKLLQNQLENTEKVREETQKTMKVLREQFDTLVREMNRQVAQKAQEGGGSPDPTSAPQRHKHELKTGGYH